MLKRSGHFDFHEIRKVLAGLRGFRTRGADPSMSVDATGSRASLRKELRFSYQTRDSNIRYSSRIRDISISLT